MEVFWGGTLAVITGRGLVGSHCRKNLTETYSTDSSNYLQNSAPVVVAL